MEIINKLGFILKFLTFYVSLFPSVQRLVSCHDKSDTTQVHNPTSLMESFYMYIYGDIHGSPNFSSFYLLIKKILIKK